MSETPIKRRWFMFSLRRLFVVITLLCVALGGYIGWQAKIVRDRTVLSQKIKLDGGKCITASLAMFVVPNLQSEQVPFIRRLFGDEAVVFITAPSRYSQLELDRIREAFPEANLSVAPK